MSRTGVASRSGAALVLVLAALLVISLLAMSLALTAALDGLAARNAQNAVRAEGQSEGALQLAAMSLLHDPARSPGVLGPWPDMGISATVHVSPASEGAWRLESRAVVGRSLIVRSAVLRIADDGTFRVAARR